MVLFREKRCILGVNVVTFVFSTETARHGMSPRRPSEAPKNFFKKRLKYVRKKTNWGPLIAQPRIGQTNGPTQSQLCDGLADFGSAMSHLQVDPLTCFTTVLKRGWGTERKPFQIQPKLVPTHLLGLLGCGFFLLKENLAKR